MRKKHPFRHALLATVGTVSGIVLLLMLKPTTAPSPAQAEPATTSSASGLVSPSASAHPPSASPSPSKTPEEKRPPSPFPSSSPSSSSSSTSTQPPHTASAAPTRAGSAPSAPKTTSAAPATRTVTGSAVETKYGPVQVRITLTGSRITEASALRYPDGTARSRDINSTAVPRLNQETLQAQSADIDTVSGATYTSAGYRQSLQSALDLAGA